MVRVTRIGEASSSPESEYPCPRGCGTLTRKFAFRKSFRHWVCKKCKGVMLDTDEINSLPLIGRGKIKKNKLDRFLDSGGIGPLPCGACNRHMNEIDIAYNEPKPKGGGAPPPLDLGLGGELGFIIIPILVIIAIIALIDKAAPKNGKKGKTNLKDLRYVKIDGCKSCSIFWFDKGELSILKKVKIEESHSGLKIEDVEWVEIAPAGTRPTSGVVTPSKSEME